MTKPSNNKNTSGLFQTVFNNVTEFLGLQSNEDKYKNFYGIPTEQEEPETIDDFHELLSRYQYKAEDIDTLTRDIERNAANGYTTLRILEASEDMDDLMEKISSLKNSELSEGQEFVVVIPYKNTEEQWTLVQISSEKDNKLKVTTFNPCKNKDRAFIEAEKEEIEEYLLDNTSFKEVTFEESTKPNYPIKNHNSGPLVMELLVTLVDGDSPKEKLEKYDLQNLVKELVGNNQTNTTEQNLRGQEKTDNLNILNSKIADAKLQQWNFLSQYFETVNLDTPSEEIRSASKIIEDFNSTVKVISSNQALNEKGSLLLLWGKLSQALQQTLNDSISYNSYWSSLGARGSQNEKNFQRRRAQFISRRPTQYPTQKPNPTTVPTVISTTSSPSQQPSLQTPAPTVTYPDPTSEPSGQPSLQTPAPTDKSNSPSLAQTAAPSQETNIPTITTINPTTNQPSPPSSQIIVNTNSPTNLNTNSSSPSSVPSESDSQTLPPTFTPTIKVIGAPSFKPTFNRSTSSPTIRLTDDKFPTSLPSSLTGNPTGNPSRNPSSSRPSFRPSLETITESPTRENTPVNGTNSSSPTLFPSGQPNSLNPSFQQPSNLSKIPTLMPSSTNSTSQKPEGSEDFFDKNKYYLIGGVAGLFAATMLMALRKKILRVTKDFLFSPVVTKETNDEELDQDSISKISENSLSSLPSVSSLSDNTYKDLETITILDNRPSHQKAQEEFAKIDNNQKLKDCYLQIQTSLNLSILAHVVMKTEEFKHNPSLSSLAIDGMAKVLSLPIASSLISSSAAVLRTIQNEAKQEEYSNFKSLIPDGDVGKSSKVVESIARNIVIRNEDKIMSQPNFTGVEIGKSLSCTLTDYIISGQIPKGISIEEVKSNIINNCKISGITKPIATKLTHKKEHQIHPMEL